MKAQLLTILAPALASLATALLSAAVAKLVAFLQAKTKLANLAGIALAAEQVLDAAVAKAGAEGARVNLLDLVAAAKASALANLPGIEKMAEAELNALVHGAVSQAMTPGGAVVNLPSQGGK